MTLPKPEQIDTSLQVGGFTLLVFLVKWGLRQRRKNNVESLGLTDKNIQWAQNMMDRLDLQIGELQRRLDDLEAERDALRRELEEYKRRNLLLEMKVRDLQNGKTKA
jgi:peptidoglycan hydrolase CwlO-like protein